MFNRQKAPRDRRASDTSKNDEPRALTTGTSDPAAAPVVVTAESVTGPVTGVPVSDAVEDVQEMLARLDALGQGESTTAPNSWARLADQATSHADSLRATLGAQQQAQRMLELATQERSHATAQAEQILLEAQAMASRLNSEAEDHARRARKETSAWAADQRKAIDDLVIELTNAATRDADDIRSEAMRSALLEAEEAATTYVTRASIAGDKDADAVRRQARQVLNDSTSLVADAQDAMQQFAESMSDFLVTIRHKVAGIEAMLQDVASGDEQSTDPADISDAEVAAALGEPIDEPTDESAVAVVVVEDIEDGASTDSPVPAATKHGLGAGQNGTSARPLGTLFRGPIQ